MSPRFLLAFLWGGIDRQPDRTPFGPCGQHAADTQCVPLVTRDLPIGHCRSNKGAGKCGGNERAWDLLNTLSHTLLACCCIQSETC